MEKEFVPYELAVKLKELGFDEPCFGDYFKFGIQYEPFLVTSEDRYRIEEDNKGEDIYRVSAPTFSQAFRWFREKYFIHHKIGRDFDIWEYELYDFKSGNKHILTGFKTFKTYEEAELACLDKLIEIVEGITEPN